MKRFLLLICVLYFGRCVFAQSINIISISYDMVDEMSIEAFSNKYPTENALSLHEVYGLEGDLRSDKIYLNINNNTIELLRHYLEEKNNQVYHVYFEADRGFLSISKYYNDILGEISVDGMKYQIVTIDNRYFIYDVDDYVEENDDEEYYNDDEDFGIAFQNVGDTAIIKILVLYTRNSMIHISGIQPFVFDKISVANRSFASSNINARLELAYIGSTDYDEYQNESQTLNKFSNNNDGYMDEVHELRNKYSADVCILLANLGDSICGKAKQIKANSETAFYIVNSWPHCQLLYSFHHELGHLIGCRHDVYKDNHNTPYAYGHGFTYINGTSSFRTIMAYSNACNQVNVTCNRINYWSTPEIVYKGVIIGDTSKCNNARVWNNRAGIVSEFRSSPNYETLTAYDIAGMSYGNLTANNYVETQGNVTISSGSTLDIESGRMVVLTPGFHAAEGSSIHVSINENIRSANSLACMSSQGIEEEKTRYKIYETAPLHIANILQVPQEQNFSKGIIYSATGQYMHEVYSRETNVDYLPRGVYLLYYVTDSGARILKFIKE